MMKLVAEFSIQNGQYYWYHRITPLVLITPKFKVMDVVMSGDAAGQVTGGPTTLVGFPYIGGN